MTLRRAAASAGLAASIGGNRQTSYLDPFEKGFIPTRIRHRDKNSITDQQNDILFIAEVRLFSPACYKANIAVFTSCAHISQRSLLGDHQIHGYGVLVDKIFDTLDYV